MMAELAVGLDSQQQRFSTNFLDEMDVTKSSADAVPPPLVERDKPVSPVSTNPFRSESPTPSDQGLELDHNAPEFNFVAHLETHDSVSSLDQIGLGSPSSDQNASPAHQATVNGISADSGEKIDPSSITTATTDKPGAADSKATPTLVARDSENWETFDENGKKVEEPHPPTANGGHSGGQEKESKAKGSWEKFEDSHQVSKKLLSSVRKGGEERGTGGGGGAVCAADAMVSDSQWTALDDSRHRELFDDADESYDDQNLPFRKTQSMRATANRRIQIVDSLRQRRLSNSSLDREPMKPSQFKNEDDLTRNFQIQREWQVYVKMDKRVPGTKTKWLPVNISIKDGVLVIKRSTPPSMPISSSTVVPPDTPPLHEFRLHHNHMTTPPQLRPYNRKTKLHQIKLRQTQVHEKRTLRRWLLVEHVSSARTFIKLGCPDLTTIQSLYDQLNEALRQLPVTRQRGVAYRINEVFIDVKEHSDILMNCDGAVLERKSLNRVYVQAFLSDNPECRLFINDIEAILLQGKGQMTTSMSRQVRLNDTVLHPCVDKSAYKTSRELKFRPLDGYPFELLRCSIDPYVSPPVNVTALMEYSEQRNTVRVTASFTLRKKHNLRLRPIKDLVIKFPIPSSWSSLFLADTKFGGKKSVRSTSSLRGSFRRKIKSHDCQIETMIGSAKYEPEHGAILWRIGQYIESTLPHNFRCDIQLKSGMHRPDITKEHCEVSYTLPGSSTGLEVRGFKVHKSTPERWVKYEIHYRYRVQMFPDLSID